MTPSATLTIKPRGQSARSFLPEQEAAFDITLRNTGSAPASLVSLSGNLDTPAIHLLDSGGKVIGQYTEREAIDRMTGDGATIQQPGPQMVALAPGGEDATFVNLWSYAHPLSPGSYAVEVTHRPTPGGGPITSPRLPFSIVPAKVFTAALGFESSQRTSTILAWLAAGQGGTPRLLARLSGMSSHVGLHMGARVLGEYPTGTRIAIGEIPPEGSSDWTGWVAAVSASEVELIRHNMTQAEWRSGPIALPVTDSTPVPRFPDRGRAIFLATGTGRAGAPALAGAVVDQTGEKAQTWSLPLPVRPQHSACLFGMRHPIVLLVSGDDGSHSSLYRIVVDEAGNELLPAERVRNTENVVLAVVADMRFGATPTFLVLEAQRGKLDQITLVRVPLRAEAAAEEPKPFPNWPKDQTGQAAMPSAISIEPAGQEVAIALTDAAGRLFGGTLAEGIRQISPQGLERLVFPHVGAVNESTTISAFTSEGLIYHAVQSGHVH